MSTKEELPKMVENLKSELISEHHLKKTVVEEKVVLPTKEDLESARKEQRLLSEIESFSPEKQLKNTETHEKVVLPTKEEILAEKQSN